MVTLSDHPIVLILIAAVVAPLLAELPVARRVPVVVFEVLLGILIGPHLLGLVRFDAFVSTMTSIGMAALLFIAGMELDFAQIRGRPLSLALRGWLVSLAVGFMVVAILHVIPGVEAPIMTVLALTTTGLGVLLPILRDGGLLGTPFGRMMIASGAVGEVAPIVAVSLALSNRYSSWQEFLFLLCFLAVVALAIAVGIGVRPPRLLALLGRTLHSSTQLPVRLALLTLAGLFVLSQALGFEGILGAFAAGMIVGSATRGEQGEAFRVRIEAICFGWFTPFFFVGTGVAFDLGSLVRDVATMLLVPSLLLLMLLARGLPALLYRAELAAAQRAPFALATSAASLGLVVVITEIGLHTEHMNRDTAHALIGAALLSSVLYPVLAGVLLARTSPPDGAGPAKALGSPPRTGED